LFLVNLRLYLRHCLAFPIYSIARPKDYRVESCTQVGHARRWTKQSGFDTVYRYRLYVESRAATINLPLSLTHHIPHLRILLQPISAFHPHPTHRPRRSLPFRTRSGHIYLTASQLYSITARPHLPHTEHPSSNPRRHRLCNQITKTRQTLSSPRLTLAPRWVHQVIAHQNALLTPVIGMNHCTLRVLVFGLGITNQRHPLE
jgi:hypothetical protein